MPEFGESVGPRAERAERLVQLHYSNYLNAKLNLANIRADQIVDEYEGLTDRRHFTLAMHGFDSARPPIDAGDIELYEKYRSIEEKFYKFRQPIAEIIDKSIVAWKFETTPVIKKIARIVDIGMGKRDPVQYVIRRVFRRMGPDPGKQHGFAGRVTISVEELTDFEEGHSLSEANITIASFVRSRRELQAPTDFPFKTGFRTSADRYLVGLTEISQSRVIGEEPTSHFDTQFLNRLEAANALLLKEGTHPAERHRFV